jgi:hypothetical protein
MSANFPDESLDAVARVLPPRRLRATANPSAWTNLFAGINPSPGLRRFYLTLGASPEPYELRFHADDAEGIAIPAGVIFHYPLPLGIEADAMVKLTSGTSATITGLVAVPDTQ